MALYLLQPGIQPIGQFDMLDTQLSTVKGGEFGVLSNTQATANQFTAGADKAAYDVFEDGYYAISNAPLRPVMTIATGSGAVAGKYYLLDDGQSTVVPGSVTTTGYGTLFGSVIGTPVGLSFSGANLGPHTAAASGKVTCWGKSGLYAVSIDNVDATLASPGASNLAVPGAALYRNATGQLTTSNTTGDQVGTFVEFSNNGSLVTTPLKQVSAQNAGGIWDRVVFQYNGR